MMLRRTGRDRDPRCRSKAGSMRAGGPHGVVRRVCPTAGPHLLLLRLLRCLPLMHKASNSALQTEQSVYKP